jgi:hypothetical protein
MYKLWHSVMITESQGGNEASRYAARQWCYCDITEKHPHFQINRWLSAVIKRKAPLFWLRVLNCSNFDGKVRSLLLIMPEIVRQALF